MISNEHVQQIVRRVDTSIRLGGLIRAALVCGLIYGLFVASDPILANIILIAVCLVWVWLSIQARRKASLTATATRMIAIGQVSQASGMLVGICRGFCLHKPVVLMACHNLAVILQKQRQWLGAWQFCELVRSWAGKRFSEIRILSEAVRADCSLAMNNLAATYESLSVLSRMSLSVTERLSVLPAEIDYCIRVGRSDVVMTDLPNKVALTGLLPTEQAGIAHASLALAAHLVSQTARRDWLWHRATVYCSEEELLTGRDALQLIAQAVSSANAVPPSNATQHKSARLQGPPPADIIIRDDPNCG